ncbi:acyltransferase [uncultured Gemmiger sp.]|uniref:acyltransferase family protein n=1 Tax=uncultured Gemmiger sp. TaxID=1623490 RepID=UPI0025E8373E|nr:acyltransferase [uncultured Gemmiger sp.]
MSKRPRLFYLDLVRTVALVCILVVHFNATVTGYFTLPHKLFTSTLPGGVYLGDFGSSLFFIVSGAALAYTARRPFSVPAFYRRRAMAVYPMFWLAWCICFSLRFVTQPGYYAAAKTPTLLLTFLGLDNFAVAAGIVSTDFACVGEWFLGSILFFYLLFPLLYKAMQRSRLFTWLVTAVLALALHASGLDRQLIGVHLLEFLFGIWFVGGRRPARWALVPAVLTWPVLWALGQVVAIDAKIFCALVSAAVFTLMSAWPDRAVPAPLARGCALAGKYSYAVFLVHHFLILQLVQRFDLAALTRRDTALLFVAYLILTALASWGLYRLDARVRAAAGRLAAP